MSVALVAGIELGSKLMMTVVMKGRRSALQGEVENPDNHHFAKESMIIKLS